MTFSAHVVQVQLSLTDLSVSFTLHSVGIWAEPGWENSSRHKPNTSKINEWQISEAKKRFTNEWLVIFENVLVALRCSKFKMFISHPGCGCLDANAIAWNGLYCTDCTFTCEITFKWLNIYVVENIT